MAISWSRLIFSSGLISGSRLGLIVVALGWLLSTASAFAVEGDAGTPAPLLDAGVGARSAALGGAYIAVSEGAGAGYWNPAALAVSGSGRALVGRGSLFGGISMETIAASSQGWGISVLRLSSGPIPKTDADGKTIGTFEDAQIALYLSHGREVRPGLLTGVSLKWYSEELDGERANGIAVDIGLLYQLNANVRLASVVRQPVGMAVSWSTGHRDIRPVAVDVGASWELRKRVRMTGDLTLPSLAWRAGVEWSIAPGLSLRAGRAPNGFTAGVGVGTEAFGLDYAFVSHRDLQGAHRLSASFGF